MAHYDTAQICANGHVINKFSTDFPAKNQNFCEKCGAPSLSTCPECAQRIRGAFHSDVISLSPVRYDLPAYCLHCGRAYPWTEMRIVVAKQFASEIPELSEDERTTLASTVEDIVRQSPTSVVAENRFRVLMKKAGQSAAEGMRAIIIDVLSEAVKKSLFP